MSIAALQELLIDIYEVSNEVLITHNGLWAFIIIMPGSNKVDG
jgi:hypothetical protein